MQANLPAAMAELIAGVTRVRVLDSGVMGGPALADRVLGEFVGQDAVELLALIAVRQPIREIYCMCYGNPALELWVEDQLRATIGVYHGHSPRVADWWSDAPLRDGKALLRWLADHNITAPIETFDSAAAERGRAASRREACCRCCYGRSSAGARQDW